MSEFLKGMVIGAGIALVGVFAGHVCSETSKVVKAASDAAVDQEVNKRLKKLQDAEQARKQEPKPEAEAPAATPAPATSGCRCASGDRSGQSAPGSG